MSADVIDPDAPVESSARRGQLWVTLAVGVGGVLGAEARFGLSTWVAHGPSGFPWATVLINVSGCFAIGVFMAVLAQLSSPHPLLRPLFGIGVLGGYTSFSTFTVDTERLVLAHRSGIAASYVLCTLVLGAVAVAAGTISTQLFVRRVHDLRIWYRRARGRDGHPSARAATSRRRR